MPHGHLRRLEQVWIERSIFFVTACAAGRRPLFARPDVFDILRAHFDRMRRDGQWRIGQFVVMPDHVHFFCCCAGGSDAPSLSSGVGGFKQWSAKAMMRDLGFAAPIWQREFFDHLLRSGESYASKWRYVVENPVRAGLVAKAEDWPYAGELDEL